MGTRGCTETTERTNQYCLTSQKKSVVIYVARKPEILRRIKLLWQQKVYKHYAAGSRCYFTVHCLHSFTQMTWRGSRKISPQSSVFLSFESVTMDGFLKHRVSLIF